MTTKLSESMMERTASAPALSLDVAWRGLGDGIDEPDQEEREHQILRNASRNSSRRRRHYVERMSITMCALHHEIFPSMDDLMLPAPRGSTESEDDLRLLTLQRQDVSEQLDDTESLNRRRTLFPNLNLRQRENKGRQLWLSLAAVVFFGCAAVVPTELAVRRQKDAMSMITLTNYVLVSTETWLDRGSKLLHERRIPMRAHLVIFGLGLGYNVAQNKAIADGLPIALVLLLKNSQIIFQMAANSLFLGEKYLLIHELSALIVVIGVLTVLSSADPDLFDFHALWYNYMHPTSKDTEHIKEDTSKTETTLLVGGIGLMITAVVCRAGSNLVSQAAFLKKGNHYSEKLFYEHALGLPLLLVPFCFRVFSAHEKAFGTMTSSSSERNNQEHDTTDKSNTDPLSFLPQHLTDYIGFTSSAHLPWLWIFIFIQAFCTWECTRSCERVVGLSGGVSLAIVLVFQRFVSTLFSAIILNKPTAALTLWIGSLLVLFGVSIYVLAPKPKRRPGAVGACFAFLVK